MTVSGDPSLLLQPIEPATDARCGQAEVGRYVERTGKTSETLERRQHIEPSDRNVPIGTEFFVDVPLQFADEGLESAPRSNADVVKARHRT